MTANGVWSMATGALEAVRRGGFVIARLALGLIVLSYSFEVVSRYFFNAPTWWSAELVSYLLCILVFSMMPYVTAAYGHVAVTVLLENVPERPRHMIERIILIVGFVTCAAITWFATDEITRQIARNVQMMATHPIPKWWISSWIVFGFAFSSLEFLRLAIEGRASVDPIVIPEL